ncbi:MAG: hypothetical protein WDN66_01000 [Candidatus Saccharibacteria bacterium]
MADGEYINGALLVDGELKVFTPEEHAELAQKLGGISITVVLMNNGGNDHHHIEQPFASITSPDHFMLKEAFDDYGTTVEPDVSSSNVSRAFSSLIQSKDRKFYGFGEDIDTKLILYTPDPYGGIVEAVSRRSLHIPEHEEAHTKKITASVTKIAYTILFAVRAGSVLEATAPLIDKREGGAELTKTEEVFATLAEHLAVNLQS